MCCGGRVRQAWTMWNSENRAVSRRAVLGGAVIGVMGAGLGPTWAASASGGSVDEDSIDAVASTLDADLIELRRDIHRNPELAGQEQRTAGLVAQRLAAAGLDVTTGVGGYGVVGVLTGAHRGRRVAYRADMDAVPPKDQFGGGPEPAHVCGHDIHTAVGVGVAQVLARLRHRLSGTVVFVFQPGEESLTGAAAMLADGVLTQTRPAEIHALHCAPFPVGQFFVTPGFGLPGQDRGTVTLTGADAMARAQQLATQIIALGTVPFPATTQAREQLLADIQTPHGPLATFVAMQAQAVQAEGGANVRVSYRCWPENRYLVVRQDIQRLAGPATVSFPNDPFPAMICPEREGKALKHYLRKTRGHDAVHSLYAAIPFNGEDFALFLDQIPGTYTFLGVRTPGTTIEESYPHFGTFNPDERAIGHGVRAMAGWLAQRAHG
jgi:amidohydrolase